MTWEKVEIYLLSDLGEFVFGAFHAVAAMSQAYLVSDFLHGRPVSSEVILGLSCLIVLKRNYKEDICFGRPLVFCRRRELVEVAFRAVMASD